MKKLLLLLLPLALQAQPMLRTTTFTRDLLRATNAADGRSKLGIAAATEGSWSFVVIPDSQFLIEDDTNWANQIYWLTNNHEVYDIQAILHVGDMVDDANLIAQWTRATNYLSLSTNCGNIPFLPVPGNHDYYGSTIDYWRTNGVTTNWLNSRSWFNGGYLDGEVVNNYYITKSLGGRDYVFIGLDYFPSNAVVTWAAGVLAAYSNHWAIIWTHSFLTESGTLVTTNDAHSPTWYGYSGRFNGFDLWHTMLKTNNNVLMIFCGHDINLMANSSGRSRLDLVADDGHVAHAFFQNWQQNADRAGRLVIYTVDHTKNLLSSRIYAPGPDTWYTDSQSQYSIPLVTSTPEDPWLRWQTYGHTNRLRIWGRFNEMSGTATTNSISGPPIYSTNSPWWGWGIQGASTLVSNSVSWYCTNEYSLSGNNHYTAAAWLRYTNCGLTDAAVLDIVMSKYNQSTDGEWYFGIVTNNGAGTFALRNRMVITNTPAATNFDVTIPSLADGTWHHVATTHNWGVRKIYLDGQLMGTDATTAKANMGRLSMEFTIGTTAQHLGYPDENNYAIVGWLDDVHFYDRVLSDQEILYLYKDRGGF